VKKKFIVIGLLGLSLSWLLQPILGGIFYAVAAFFTKEGLEKWKSKKSGIEKEN